MESSSVEELDIDVKVCDICGDAGREDMLAICTRCTDGAEHTYCMRKMLRKVPAANWMCEECKLSPTKRLAEPPPPPAPKRQALETTARSTLGPLFKSKSFNASNSKPKVKPLDLKGPTKDQERSKFLQKSISFKSDSKLKMLSPRIDSKGSRSMKAAESNNRDLRVQNEGKSGASKPRTSVELKSKDDADNPSSSVDGTKETPLRPRSTAMSNSRSTFCQKCKEIGHSAEFCPTATSEAPAPIATSIKEEGTHGISNLKEAIHAALLRKPEIQRRKRTLDQVEDVSTSTTTHFNSEIASNKSKIIAFGEATVTRNSTQPCVTSHALAASPPLVKMFAIPEYECIWRGCFEVNGSGSLMEVCGGIQAHLSTCVSPRVPEAVRKFPQKLSLNEVPRLSTWPSQFCDAGAKEDNIALYFFAKDVESYERNYKSSLDSMIKNDLALKGTFEGVELLIFPSNQLPESSQRWNMLFFLWGVFRARRVHSCDSSAARNDATAIPQNLCLHKLISSECERCSSKSTEDCNEEKQYTSDAMRETKAVCSEKKVLEVFGGWKAKDVSVEEKICVVEDCEEKVIAEDFGTATEMRFFPVDPRRPTTDNHHRHNRGGGGGALGFPNLELALGAETKPPPPLLPPPAAGNAKGMLPFLVSRAIDINDDNNDDGAVEEGVVPASLSLSLSFPMKEQPPQPSKPVSKPPPPVNTSLLLFGSFPDK